MVALTGDYRHPTHGACNTMASTHLVMRTVMSVMVPECINNKRIELCHNQQKTRTYVKYITELPYKNIWILHRLHWIG